MAASFYAIGLQANTDKISHHGYHRFYPKHLESLRCLTFAMLEVGVADYASIKMWLDYFPQCTVYGMDIGPKSSGDRYTILQADQSDLPALHGVSSVLPDLQFIIDDGSHIPEHQLQTFDVLFQSNLAEGGTYIIEDIETSYWKNGDCYGYPTAYGYKHSGSCVEVFKAVVDHINKEFIADRLHAVPISNATLDWVETVQFCQNCIVITKKTAADKALYDNRAYRFAKRSIDFNNFVFVPYIDGYGSDHTRLTQGDLNQWKQTTVSLDCVAVNTLGFVKRSITRVDFSPCFEHGNASQGLWVTATEYAHNPAFAAIKTLHAKPATVLNAMPCVSSVEDLRALGADVSCVFSATPLDIPVASRWKRIRTYAGHSVYATASSPAAIEAIRTLPCGADASRAWFLPALFIEYAARVVGGFVSERERANFVRGAYNEQEVRNIVARKIDADDEDGKTWKFENSLKLSMIGLKRLRGLGEHILSLDAGGIAGDIIETGVWKGGACIFAGLCLREIGNPYGRCVIGCDSFEGLPPPNIVDFPQDKGDIHYTHECLAISIEAVRANAALFRLENIQWVKGWFKDTLPALAASGVVPAILRLDGDMYESTIQALEIMEPHVPANGVVIIDDYSLAGAYRATHDYRLKHGIASAIQPYHDGMACFWIKI